MKKWLRAILVIIALLLAGCRQHTPTPTAVPLSTPSTDAPAGRLNTPVCSQSGTTEQGKIVVPDAQVSQSYSVYLPPCYAEFTWATYPVLYWAAAGDGFITGPAESLILQGEVPPFLVVMLEIDFNAGAGTDSRIIQYVVPYIDSHYRTQPDRLSRSITGISHGAAIAVRTAFQAPDIFSRVAVISGGISDGEQEKFTGWISAMPPDQRPAVLIDVGEQDGVIALTHHFTALLDQLSFPYTFILDPGNHHTESSDSHFPDYLKWLMAAR